MPSPDSSRLTARLYLEAVLPTLAALPGVDDEAATLIREERFGIRFQTSSGSSGTICFENGKSSSTPIPHVPVLKLWLASDNQCVRLFSKRGLALPLPIGGWTVLPKLPTFQKLADRMEKLLQPEPSELENPKVLQAHVFLSLHLAIHALVPMLERDPVGIKTRSTLPKGIASFRYRSESFPELWIDLRGDRPVAGTGTPPASPLVTLDFRNDEAARLAMANQLDSLAALGRGDLALNGFVPFADGLDLVMQRIQPYLLPAS
jgi:hypothetical protein